MPETKPSARSELAEIATRLPFLLALALIAVAAFGITVVVCRIITRPEARR